jgi:hypothetical protein
MARIAVLAAVAVLAGSVTLPEAHAKTCLSIMVAPLYPRVGKPAVIEVRAFTPKLDASGSQVGYEPARDPFPRGSEFVDVDGPRGAGAVVRLRQNAGDPSLWRARYTFRRAGAWQISWAGWAFPESACVPTARIRVRAR